jgi:hypothetical protein
MHLAVGIPVFSVKSTKKQNQKPNSSHLHFTKAVQTLNEPNLAWLETVIKHI